MSSPDDGKPRRRRRTLPQLPSATGPKAVAAPIGSTRDSSVDATAGTADADARRASAPDVGHPWTGAAERSSNGEYSDEPPRTPSGPKPASQPLPEPSPPLPTVHPPAHFPRSKKEVSAEVSRKNVMAWLGRVVTLAATPSPFVSPARSTGPSRSTVDARPAPPPSPSVMQPDDPAWLLATGSPRSAFSSRTAELLRMKDDDSPPTYNRVKDVLVSEFGVQKFREHRALIQDQLLVLAHANLPSTSRETLRSMHDVVRGACHESKSSGDSITWIHLKRELVERFGAARVESFKTTLQMWLQFYTENNGDMADFTSPLMPSSSGTDAEDDTALSRVKQRTQMRENLRARLQVDVSMSQEERSFLMEQLFELDQLLITAEEDDGSSGSGLGAAFVLLPDGVLASVARFLPAYTYLAILPRVCRRLRDWVRSAAPPPLQLSWARRVLSDRTLKAKLLALVGPVTGLYLQRCGRLTDAGCASIAATCSDLLTLDISGCDRITDAGVSRIVAGCPKIVRWCLFECPNVSSASVRAIAEANPSLERLVVGREEPMTDADAGFGGPQPIDATTIVELARQCADIRLLRLRAVPSALNDGGIQALVSSGAPLTTLDLANCDVPCEIGKMLVALGGTLCDVSLAGNARVVDDTVIELVRSCPLLTRIDVSGCRELTDAACTEGLAAHGHRFVRVGLARCSSLTDASLQALASSGQSLRSLDVGFCDRITDVGVASVIRRCPQLRRLDVTCCFQLTSAALVVLGERTRELRALSVRGCTGVSDVGLVAVAAGCPFLADLNVWMCPLVTDDGIGDVIRRCPLLQSLAVCGCPLVTDVTADLVARLASSALIDVAYSDAGFTAGGRGRLDRRLCDNRVRTGTGKTGGAAFHPSSLLRN